MITKQDKSIVIYDNQNTKTITITPDIIRNQPQCTCPQSDVRMMYVVSNHQLVLHSHCKTKACLCIFENQNSDIKDPTATQRYATPSDYPVKSQPLAPFIFKRSSVFSTMASARLWKSNGQFCVMPNCNNSRRKCREM